ncbi:MAG: DUF58 domain-containing protein, partial [Candidatus Promineifilaceae bacterium]
MSAGPRLTLRRRLPVVWLLLLAAAAVLLPGRVWNTLLIGLGGLVLVAYVWARQLQRGLSGRREVRYAWVGVGDRLSEQFELRNDSWLPALWVEVVDEGNVPGYRPAVVRSLGARAGDRWRSSAVCRQRGQFRLGPWALHSGDPFGIFSLTIPYPPAGEIVIHPPIHQQLPLPLPAGGRSGRARTAERSWQATLNAAGVRDYRPDDPLGWIHWPTSARRDGLFTRQFDLDAAGDVWLLLDMQAAAQLGQGLEGTEEHLVLLAAALAAQALRANRPAGLAAYGRRPQIIAPGRGQGQQWRLLRGLALVRADGERGLEAALVDLGRLARRGSAAVVLTPSGRADWLPALLSLSQRGVGCQIVLLDRESFASPAGADPGSSQGLAEALRQLGYPSRLVRRGQLGPPLQARPRRGYWEFKVTRTGR